MELAIVLITDEHNVFKSGTYWVLWLLAAGAFMERVFRQVVPANQGELADEHRSTIISPQANLENKDTSPEQSLKTVKPLHNIMTISHSGLTAPKINWSNQSTLVRQYSDNLSRVISVLDNWFQC